MSNQEFLARMHETLISDYGVDPLQGWMHRFRAIIAEENPFRVTEGGAVMNNSTDLRKEIDRLKKVRIKEYKKKIEELEHA